MTHEPQASVDENGIRVSRSVEVRAPIASVWETLTDPRCIAQWFGQRADFPEGMREGATGTFGWAAPMSLDYFTIHNFMSTYLSYGARMLNDEGQCGFDTPEFRQALETFTSAYERGVTHPDAPSMPGTTNWMRWSWLT